MSAGCAPQPPEDTERLMDLVESRIALPSGARPLREYFRYYFREGDKVLGHLVSQGTPGRRWIRSRDEAPEPVVDPGCSRIFVQFDTGSGRVETVSCGGVA